MLLILFMILIITMIFFGEEKGMNSVGTLLFNFVVMYAMLFFVKIGVNIYASLFISTFIFLIITVLYQNSISIASVSAFVSSFGVTVLIMLAAFFVVNNANIYGFSELSSREESLFFLSDEISIKINQIFTGALILSTLGAVVDAAISVSSSMCELYMRNNKFDKKDFLKSCNTMGDDILGMGINTLLFAFMGETLRMCLYLKRSNYDFLKLLNSKAFNQDVYILVFSAVGCLIIIPVTIFVTDFILTNNFRFIRAIRNYSIEKQKR